VAKQLKISKPEDWYNVKLADVIHGSGGSLLNHYYNNSLYNALQQLYPEHMWLPWRFDKAPKGLWADVNNQRKFFDNLAITMKINNMEDWYNVSPAGILEL
jgi:hypothetical protein